MILFFINNFLTFSSYTSTITISLLNYLPICLYFTFFIWIISLILMNNMSTRINSVNLYRTSVKNSFIVLFKL